MATAGVGAGLFRAIGPHTSTASAAAAAIPKRGGTLTVGIEEDLTSIDPHRLNGVGDLLIQGLLAQPLVAGNAEDKIEPVLAESFRSESGGKVWIFNLRKGVRFHNGREMTADDVKWSFDRILDKKVGAILTSVFSTINVKTTPIDKYTVRVDITSGFGSFLSNLAQSTRAAVLARESVDADGKVTRPIGTGPFQFVDWRPGVEFRVKRHDAYWQMGADGKPLPYIDAMTLKIVTDPSARLNGLLAGELEFVTQPSLSAARTWLSTKPPAGIGLRRWFYNYSDYLSLNAHRAPFNDVRVRQAVANTIDRKALNDAVYFGLGEVHNEPFKRSSFWYQNIPIPPVDLAKAKRLMAEAGLGRGVDVTLLVWSPLNDQRAEVYRAQLAQIGIRAKLDKHDPGSFIPLLPKYEWDLATLIIGTIFHPDRPYTYFSRESIAHPYVGGYDDLEVEKLLVQGRDEPDPAKVKAIYGQVVRKFMAIGTPQYHVNVPLVDAFRDYVQGFDGYGRDLVAINGQMGLHKAWISK
jgi:peptide/nickel transport system substrate-binding protein